MISFVVGLAVHAAITPLLIQTAKTVKFKGGGVNGGGIAGGPAGGLALSSTSTFTI